MPKWTVMMDGEAFIISDPGGVERGRYKDAATMAAALAFALEEIDRQREDRAALLAACEALFGIGYLDPGPLAAQAYVSKKALDAVRAAIRKARGA